MDALRASLPRRGIISIETIQQAAICP